MTVALGVPRYKRPVTDTGGRPICSATAATGSPRRYLELNRGSLVVGQLPQRGRKCRNLLGLHRFLAGT